jgi:hypothetical protein
VPTEVVSTAEIVIVMELSAAPVMVALPVTMFPPPITVVMPILFAPLSIQTSFLPLPMLIIVAMVIAAPIELPMLA